MQIPELYNIYIEYPTISTDSRTIKKRDIFWALKGENFNGNKFIDNAISKGASYAITDDLNYKNKPKCIYFKDSLKTLQDLASFHRKRIGIPIIAITGTNGKTTTKELITQVLKQNYNVKATSGNFNNHIGVPLTLLSFNKSTEIGIVEMGANHPKEIEFLCNIAKPDYGIITNIGKAHLEGFKSFEVLIKTKAELYTAITSKKGKIFINDDNELLKSLIENQEIIKYGTKNNVFSKGKILSANPFVKFELKEEEKITEIISNLIGQYNFENLMAASCIGKYFNIETKKIKKAIENYIPKNNRSQIIKIANSNIILDAYNANPTSMSLAIKNFSNIKANNKILILGDMFELGNFSKEEHTKIIQSLINIKDLENSQIFLAGEFFHKLNSGIFAKSKIKSFKTTEDLIKHIAKLKFKKSWILIKGSRGMKLESVIEYLNFS